MQKHEMMDKIIQYQMREISTVQVAKCLDEYTEVIMKSKLPVKEERLKPAVLKQKERNLTMKVMLRKTGAIHDNKGFVKMSLADLKSWFENGDHLKTFTEYDLL